MNFDRVARYYQCLESLRFGKALQRARCAHLRAWTRPIPSSMLVLGDGDGRFTAELCRQWPETQITVVDASARMVTLAKARLPGGALVQFHVCDVFDYLETIDKVHFEVIVSHFLLDCFSEQTLSHLVSRLTNHLSQGGCWVVSDFSPGLTRWQRFTVWLMLRFFHLAARLEAKALPDIRQSLQQAGLQRRMHKSWASGWIWSDIWEHH